MKPFVPPPRAPRSILIDPVAINCAALTICVIVSAIGIFMGAMS